MKEDIQIFLGLKTTILVCVVLTIIIFLWAIDTNAGNITYTYDNLNRLIHIENDDGTVVEYSYDAAGNRLQGVISTACEGDFATTDGDVDGSDLAAYIADNAGISLDDFAGDFGRTNCP